jgi:multiple sugar transport system substrate-binding protein
MKYLFLVIAMILGISAAAIRLSFPDLSSTVPVIYWVTDPNPARVMQVNGFHRWQVQEGHTITRTYADADEALADLGALPLTLLDDVVVTHPSLAGLFPEVTEQLLRDEPGQRERIESETPAVWPMVVRLPRAEMRTDAANSDQTKKVIQSVSGVGSDVMDLGSGLALRQFEAMGVLADVTEDAQRLGFGVDKTYASVVPEITVNGRQSMFPCNVTTYGLWVNINTFRSAGMDPPPTRWTLDEFERIGVEFCERANRGKSRRVIFFADTVSFDVLRRSVGVPIFNETLTASRLDDPRHVEMLKRHRAWVYDLNILPTPDDRAAASVAQGYGGPQLQLFSTGRYAMIAGGRWQLIEFRKFPNLGPLGVSEFPHAGFPNTLITTRAAAVYVGSQYPEESRLFLAYLASEEYNQQIVEDADALPPNPAFTRSEAYLNPVAFPSEAGVHMAWVQQAHSIAIANELTPFEVPTVIFRIIGDWHSRFTVGQVTAEYAASQMQREINERIAWSIERKPEIQPAFEQALYLQSRIDERHARSEPIPENWIDNTYLLAYYRQQGKLASAEPRPQAPASVAADAEPAQAP